VLSRGLRRLIGAEGLGISGNMDNWVKKADLFGCVFSHFLIVSVLELKLIAFVS